MRLFFNPNFDTNKPSLSEEETKHAERVLRLKEGDEIYIVDGKSNRYQCIISHLSKRACDLELIDSQVAPLPYKAQLHIAIAPTKNIDRLEWFLEKATEMGIAEITPIWCDRSERKTIKLERLHKILVSAMKQSLQATLPVLNDPVSFQTFINEPVESEKFIAHCEDGVKPHLKRAYNGSNAVVLIGPEGDFSSKEIAQAMTKSYSEVSLGENRLRTETAALVANQIIHLHHA